MAWEKIVRRVSSTSQDAVSDLVGAIDVIELHLGIGAGSPSVCDQLAALLEDVRRSGGTIDEAGLGSLQYAIEQLREVETFLHRFWTKSDPSPTRADDL